MADDAASTPNATAAASGLFDTARRVVGQVVARVPGFDGGAAQRNAWEAVCADLQRRAQWNDIVDFTVNAARRPSRRRATATPARAPSAQSSRTTTPATRQRTHVQS